MWIVRPADLKDLDAIFALAQALGSGMTTLPADRTALAKKLEASGGSFAGTLSGEDAQYLLVLEDTDTGAALGIAGVYPRVGLPGGFFSFRVERLVHYSPTLGISRAFDVLHLSNAYSGMTEIGTLAVHPDLRQGGAGRLLARSRYILMARFPHLFSEHVIAEMRGWQDAEQRSPFWSAVGAHCFCCSFAEADTLSATRGTAWIADLLPRYPIYLDFLPEDARTSVGRAHDTSAIAMAMLIEEGFKYERYVDVFDAGPQVIARRDAIKTVAEAVSATVDAADLSGEGQSALIAAGNLASFRVARSMVGRTGNGVSLDAETRRGLGVNASDEVLFAIGR